MENEKQVDESWKEDAKGVDESADACSSDSCGCGDKTDCDGNESGEMQVDFISYVSSLGFQAMIFLGLIPNPITNEIDKNVKQAKFIIDTLGMMKEKTSGNLSKQEEEILNSSVYELQMKYVEEIKNIDKQSEKTDG